MAVTGYLVELVSGDGAYPIKMAILAALVWSLCLYGWFRVIRPRKDPWKLFLLLCLPWCLPVFRDWVLQVGALESESIAAALFCGAFAAFVTALNTRALEFLFGSVALLAMAAYFRAEFDLYGTVILAAVALPVGLRVYRQRLPREALKLPILLLVVFLGLTLPWKMFMRSQYGHFGMSTAMYVSAERVFWNPEPPEFVFGGNAPCIVEPETCQRVQENKDRIPTSEKLKLAEFAFLRHPIEWLSYKAGFLDRFWFGFPLAEAMEAHPEYLFDGLFCLAAAAVALYFWMMALQEAVPGPGRDRVHLMGLIMGAFALAYSALFIIAPLEIRYTMPLRIACLFSPLACWKLRDRSGITAGG
jgi:hypothetical protein